MEEAMKQLKSQFGDKFSQVFRSITLITEVNFQPLKNLNHLEQIYILLIIILRGKDRLMKEPIVYYVNLSLRVELSVIILITKI